MDIKYGIDLGNTTSAIACYENSHAAVRKNYSTQVDTTPTVVGYTKGGLIIVGKRAQDQLMMDYVKAYKQQGTQPNTITEIMRTLESMQEIAIPNLGKSVTPDALVSEIINDLRKNVLNEKVEAAVIAVPASSGEAYHKALKEAATQAGLSEIKLVPSPVAAAIAYGMGTKPINGPWLVIDFGGTTYELTLLNIYDGEIQVIDTYINDKLGGEDIDKAIITDIIIPKLKADYSINETLNKRPIDLQNIWRKVAEEAKIQITSKDLAKIDTELGADFGTDDLGEQIELHLTITRQDLEKISEPIYQKAIDAAKDMLQRNSLEASNLGNVILIGGSTLSPIFRKMLQGGLTPNIDTSVDPVTCVAVGASMFTSAKVTSLDSRTLPLSLGLGILSADGIETYYPLPGLEKGQSLPATGEISNLHLPVAIRHNSDDRIRISIYQTESTDGSKRALYCERIYDLFLTGNDLNQDFDKSTPIGLWVRVDKSGSVNRVVVNINSDSVSDISSSITDCITAPMPEAMIYREIFDAKRRASLLGNEPLYKRITELERNYMAHHDDEYSSSLVGQLKKISTELDEKIAKSTWDRQAERLKSMYAELESDNKRYGDTTTSQEVAQLKEAMQLTYKQHNIERAKYLYEQMWHLDFKIAEKDFYLCWLKQWKSEANVRPWTDATKASSLIEQGLKLATEGANAAQLRPVIKEIRGLQPEHCPGEIPTV